MDHMFPGPVAQTFDVLLGELPGLLAASSVRTRQYERVREMLIDHREQPSAAQVVERVRALVEEPPR